MTLPSVITATCWSLIMATCSALALPALQNDTAIFEEVTTTPPATTTTTHPEIIHIHPDREQLFGEIDKLLHSHKVVLFSKTYCPYSKAIKQILLPYHIHDIHVEEIDLRRDGRAVQDVLQIHSHIHTVPQLFVDGHFIGNFDAVHDMENKGRVRPLLQQSGAISDKEQPAELPLPQH